MIRSDFEIVLASQSPRRRDLLNFLGLDYSIVTSGFDESSLRGKIKEAEEYVYANAVSKGEWVLKHSELNFEKAMIIISADTVVSLEGRILEKPVNREDAKNILRFISGKRQTVLTTLCFHYVKGANSFKKLAETFASEILLRKISESEIEDYLKTGESMDKAGAYSVQGYGSAFVKELHGSPTNAIGLPLAECAEWILKAKEIFDSF